MCGKYWNIFALEIISFLESPSKNYIYFYSYFNRQSGVFRDQAKIDEAGERVMDNNDQERERGITILAKNLAVMRKGYKVRQLFALTVSCSVALIATSYLLKNILNASTRLISWTLQVTLISEGRSNEY